jgi:hypothetical protein
MTTSTHPSRRYELDAPGEPDLPAVPISQEPSAKFKEFLELKGLKCTGERFKIVEHVF